MARGGWWWDVRQTEGIVQKIFIFFNVILPEQSQMKVDVRDSIHIIHSARLVLRAVDILACEGQFRRR